MKAPRATVSTNAACSAKKETGGATPRFFGCSADGDRDLKSPQATYDRFPFVAVSHNDADCRVGWEEIGRLLHPVPMRTVVELYPGCDSETIEAGLAASLQPNIVLRSHDALLSAPELEQKFAKTLGDDRVFAHMERRTLQEFFDSQKFVALQNRWRWAQGPVLLIGTGATLIAKEWDCLIYADLARWEIQMRQRAHRTGNLGMQNAEASAAELYKRAYFLDWRAADRLKAELLPKIDFLLDTNDATQSKMISGEQLRSGLSCAARQPLRVVPFFDPGPWGGNWMKRVFDLPDGPVNYAWCFDCVPEENSLLLGFGTKRVEVPALDLVLYRPRELLGDFVYEKFGAEFPIRFDYLDTMAGGNLSLQVHPLREYIRENFGMDHTQDESYYMMQAAEDAVVYLGLKEGIDAAEMEQDLRRAQNGLDFSFPAEKYVTPWPAKKHDHFLIPAGTIHCSGRNGVVLEISATPYIFTFKLWDWGRLGMDGRPRPIHLDHGLANIQWDRTASWVREHLINHTRELSSTAEWVEESTGLHPLEFIETRRHWFTGTVPHDTAGTVNVLNLVEGDGAIVESPSGSFMPLNVHYGETWIVPAQVGAYTVRPAGPTSRPLATIKAFVRS